MKKINTKILIFEYFPKISSEMNSAAPFYTILKTNATYVIFYFISHGVCPKNKKKIICLKLISVRGCIKILLIKGNKFRLFLS